MDSSKSSSSRKPATKPASSDLAATSVGAPAGNPGKTVVPQSLGETVVPDSQSGGLDQTLVGPIDGKAGGLDQTMIEDPAQTVVGGSPTTGATSGTKPSPGSSAASPSPRSGSQRKRVVSDNKSKPNDGGQPKKKKKGVQRLGDFELKRRLGKGGMGEVFLARQISLDRDVALKTLKPELAKRDDFVARFQREARSMAKMDHPNAVKVYAVDCDRGIHFAAIEFVDGKSVQDWIDQLKKMSIGDAIHITLACCEALQTAHDLGMVHRDIKPDNILVTNRGVVKVADFGLAKAMDDDVSMTQSGTGLGTPLYMAPEQARSAKHVDQRSDIYALGATLYHLVTGALPFIGNSAIELIISKESGVFKPARQINKEVPEKLDMIIDRMMAKDVNHRYKQCSEIAADLLSLGLANPSLTFLDGDNIAVLGVPSAMASRVGGMTAASIPPPAQRQRKRPVQPDSRRDAQRAKTVDPAAEQVWYVHHTSSKGKSALSKWTTTQVLKAIKAGTLDPTTKGKKNRDEDFLPLSQYSEFTEAMEQRLVKAKASVKANNMADMYRQIDQAERRRKKFRWVRNMFSNLVGGLGLIVYLAIIGAVLIGLWVFGPVAYEFVAQKLGLG